MNVVDTQGDDCYVETAQHPSLGASADEKSEAIRA